jgi:hypothetical protein
MITVEFKWYKDWPQTPLWGELVFSAATVDANGKPGDWGRVGDFGVLSTNGEETMEHKLPQSWFKRSSVKPGDQLLVKVEAVYCFETRPAPATVVFVYKPTGDYDPRS